MKKNFFTTTWLSSPQAQRVLPPALFLLVSVFAFGLQAPWLGYYLDDWIILNAWDLRGAEGLFEYAYRGTRPLVFWLWWLGFEVVGTNPFYWQMWALLWRWLTVVIFWLCFRQLWPRAQWQTTVAALLLAVYPVFRQQPSALTYSFHWICFFLYGLSLYWMILSTRRGGRAFYLLLGGALLAGFAQLFSQEFFVGLELVRPLVLWLALRPVVRGWRPRLARTLYYWAPYLIVLAGWTVWRMALMPTPETTRNAPRLLMGLRSAPLETLVAWVEMFFQDMVEIVLGTWYAAYQPGLFTARPFANLAAWGLAAVTLVILWVYFRASTPGGMGGGEDDPEPWYGTGIPWGLAAVIGGFIPGWIIGRHIYDLGGIYNDRFGLAAMPGAAVLATGLVDYFFRKRWQRAAIMCLLVALAVGYQFRQVTDYRWSWEKQRNLFWQLKWRAPGLEEPAAVLGDGALISYMGSWATTSALVQMYQPGGDAHFVGYWYFDLQKMGSLSALGEGGDPLIDEENFMYFNAPSANSLVIAFEPEKLQCLWVLSERDTTNRYLSEELKDALRLSNLSLIRADEARLLRADVFGPEPPREWCYYYQKGDLAAQVGDWQRVVELWREAEHSGDHPRVGVEYAPFIEGFARTGGWDTAIELSQRAYFPDFEMRDHLCETWGRIAASTQDSPERQAALDEAVERFECHDELTAAGP